IRIGAHELERGVDHGPRLDGVRPCLVEPVDGSELDAHPCHRLGRRWKDYEIVIIDDTVRELDEPGMARAVVPPQAPCRTEGGVCHFEDGFVEYALVLVRLLVIDHLFEEAAWR